MQELSFYVEEVTDVRLKRALKVVVGVSIFSTTAVGDRQRVVLHGRLDVTASDVLEALEAAGIDADEDVGQQPASVARINVEAASNICAHGRERSRCKVEGCGGASICAHGRERSRCKEGCDGQALCVHLKDKYSCKACKGSDLAASAPTVDAEIIVPFTVQGLTCADCAVQLERGLKGIAAVHSVGISVMACTMAVTLAGSVDEAGVDAFVARAIAVGKTMGFTLARAASQGTVPLRLDFAPEAQGKVSAALTTVHGVLSVEYVHSRLHEGALSALVTYEPTAVGARTILAALPEGVAGRVCAHETSAGGDDHHTARIVGAVILTIVAAVVEYGIPENETGFDRVWSGHLSGRVLVLWLLATVAVAVYGTRILRSAFAAAYIARTMTMDTLVSISAGAAYIYGTALLLAAWSGDNVEEMGAPPFETVAILLGLVAVGREVEASARRQTSRAIASLARLQRVTAVLVTLPKSPEDCCDSGACEAPVLQGFTTVLAACCKSNTCIGGGSSGLLREWVCLAGVAGECGGCTTGCCKDGTSIVGCSPACSAKGCCDVVEVAACLKSVLRATAVDLAQVAMANRAAFVSGAPQASTVSGCSKAAAAAPVKATAGCKDQSCADACAAKEAVVCADACCAETPEALDDGSAPRTSISPDLVQLGDVLEVGPGQRFPADGIIVSGSTFADESIVTGESLPLPKAVGDSCIGGTLNGDGLILLRVTALPSSGVVFSIIALIKEAQSARPRVQLYADAIAAWFTPFVLLCGIVTFAAWVAAAYGGQVDTRGLSPAAYALQYALSLIVVSCPCAIGLAVPTVVMIATSIAAQHGLLLKSGVSLEALHDVKHLVLDKTGTITTGLVAVAATVVLDPRAALRVADALGLGAAGSDGDVVIALASAVAEGSTHPLSLAIAEEGAARALRTRVSGQQERTAVSGQGIRATLRGYRLLLGSTAFLEAEGVTGTVIAVAHESGLPASASVVCLAVGGSLVGLIGLTDTVRPECGAIIASAHGRGLQVWIASGDRQPAVSAVAALIGIPPSRALGGLSPADKASLVQRLQTEGGGVAMVGDGINDAVALTAANVGIALGAGAAVAMDCADVVIKSGAGLHAVETLFTLAWKAKQRIRINFFWAFLYNVVAMPLAAGVLYPATGRIAIPPGFAGISELLSSVPVILSSLLMYRALPPPGQPKAVAAVEAPGALVVRVPA
jgi:heavy metal translocating P-type ATPase